MANIPGTVIAAKITTGDTVNTFPIGDQNEMKGGHHSVQTLAERDAITDERRAEGMTCYVADSQQVFQLIGGTANGNWIDQATATAQQLYATTVLAWAGTATGDTALRVATDGTNLAYEALQKAWYGTEAAATIGYPALVTAWVGTATANVALIAAGAGTVAATQAINMASTGTAAAAAGIDLANKALQLAQVGTVAPYLDELQDVQVPSPTVSQVLAWDGSKWIAADAPSTAAPSSFSYYLQDTSSGTGGYEKLEPLPTGGTQEGDVAVVSAATGAVYIEGYISDQLNRTLVDAGIWEFNTYATTDSQPGTVVTDIYTRSIAGVETFRFSGTSEAVRSQDVPQLMTVINAQSGFAIQTTDKIIAKYWATTEHPTPISLTIYHNGTAAYSHFHTPLRTSHNDLAGLQGGQTDQYYHVTADEDAALQGTDGTPSAGNKFVTNTDSRLATGVQGYYIATAGTSQAQDAYDLAQRAYDLASVNPAQPDVGNWLLSGGNVVWVSGYSFDVAPSVVAFNGTAVTFSGTRVTLDTADPTNDRIDLVVTDRSYGTVAVITGIPTTPPASPSYDPDTQFQLTFIPVGASTVQPEGVDLSWIYLENSEWTLTATHASINVNSAINPYAGTKDIEGTSCPNGAVVRYQAPFVFELNGYQTLYFYLAPKAGWGTRSLRVQFETSSGLTGRSVTVANNSYGFNTLNPAYQLIAIPISAFGVAVSTQVLRIRFTVVSSSGTMSGFYLDNIGMQVGVAPPTPTIVDATTTVKGIVQLEQNGGTIAGRAVTGDDYRLGLAVSGTSLAYNALQQAWYGTQAAAEIGYPALVTAWVGTATANVALSVASTGTAGLAAEITNRSNADIAEANTRGAVDTNLQEQINAINADLGISFQGTFALYMANFRNGPPDNKVTVINGVVTGQTPSYYIWEDFENYPSGTLPPLTLGSSWDGAGTIIGNPGIGVQAEDQMFYGTGTVVATYTGSLGPIVLNAGTGWAGTAMINVSYLGLKGTETFDSYALGTYTDTNLLGGGWGWLANGTVVAR